MTLLLWLFSMCILVQTIYAVWMLWMGPERSKAPEQSTEDQPKAVSIIICARNEAHNLAQHLPLILQQQGIDTEVIVVNDASTDDSESLLEDLSHKYDHLKVLHLSATEQRNFPGKKYALSRGVALAKHEHLLFCDADCQPQSPNWAAMMCRHFDSNIEIVAGYGAYKQERGWLNKMIRWETLHSFVQYSTYAHSGLPYMAVGRNLACKKSVLLQAQADPIWVATPSGDDDLLIRLMGNKNNVAIECRAEAINLSDAKKNWRDWLHQKQRHLSTGKLYRLPIRLLLGLYGLSHGLAWLLFIVLCIGNMGYIVVQMMVLRSFLYWSVWGIAARQLGERNLALFLPFGDIGWAFYNVILSPYIFFKTQKKWK